jgi:hypothetical protein
MQDTSAASGMFERLQAEAGRRAQGRVQHIQRAEHLQLLEVAAGEHAVSLVDDDHAKRVQGQEVGVAVGDELPQTACTGQMFSIGRQMKKDREKHNKRNAETRSTQTEARAG